MRRSAVPFNDCRSALPATNKKILIPSSKEMPVKHILCILTLGYLWFTASSAAQLVMQQTIVLAGVTGKFDHFAIDDAGNRLFAAATGNHSVEVVNLVTGKTEQSIGGFGKPHGVAWVSASRRLFVADGGKGELDMLAGSPLRIVQRIPLSEDADDVVYDADRKLLYVGHGGTNAANPAAIAVIQTENLTLVKDIPVASHPEALEIDEKGARIFANIADKGQILVIDAKTQEINSTWNLAATKGNTPLAYDAVNDRLLVGCRAPAKLLVLDARTGTEIASASANEGADDLFYDPQMHRAYLIAGSGWVDGYAFSVDGRPRALLSIPTVAGAKTGLFVQSKSRLLVGIPGVKSAVEIQIYASHE
jgi:DNA-binding beta-propeller fold protein YncE